MDNLHIVRYQLIRFECIRFNIIIDSENEFNIKQNLIEIPLN